MSGEVLRSKGFLVTGFWIRRNFEGRYFEIDGIVKGEISRLSDWWRDFGIGGISEIYPKKISLSYLSFRSVVVITCASHAQGPRFDPARKQNMYFLF